MELSVGKIEKKRIVGLDSLRGIAALGVVSTHFTYTYHAIYPSSERFPLYFNIGHQSVELFFIISGFVILMTLEKSRNVLDFAVSRFARLYPVFWIAVLTTFMAVGVSGLPNRCVSFTNMIWNLTMIPSVFGKPPVDVVYWTLGVELFFYIIAGFLLFIRKLYLLPYVATVAVLLGIIDSIFNIEKILSHGGYRLKSMLILPYWHLFYIGIIIYISLKERKAWQFWGLAICFLAAWCRDGLFESAIVMILGFLVWFSVNRRSAILENKVILFFGIISYSFYLIHANVGYSIIFLLERSIGMISSIAIAFISTMLFATLLCFLIERPCNRFIRNTYKAKYS